MYGYNYLEAGSNAQELFKKRGWKDIICDDLLKDVLLVVSLVIGGVVGCIAVHIENAQKSRLYSLDYPSVVAYM
jgi:hypothetical protein